MHYATYYEMTSHDIFSYENLIIKGGKISNKLKISIILESDISLVS